MGLMGMSGSWLVHPSAFSKDLHPFFFVFGSSRSSVAKALIFTAEHAETAERCSSLPDDLQSRLSAIFNN
jgi:hypothetical protein